VNRRPALHSTIASRALFFAGSGIPRQAITPLLWVLELPTSNQTPAVPLFPSLRSHGPDQHGGNGSVRLSEFLGTHPGIRDSRATKRDKSARVAGRCIGEITKDRNDRARLGRLSGPALSCAGAGWF